MSKRFKLFKIGNDKAKCIYGTVDKDMSDVFFTETKLWVKPTAKFDYEKEIKKIVFNLKKYIHSKLHNNGFEKKFIFDYSINSIGMTNKIPKLMTIDLYLKQTKKDKIDVKYSVDKLVSVMHPMIDNLVELMNDRGFVTSKERMRKAL